MFSLPIHETGYGAEFFVSHAATSRRFCALQPTSCCRFGRLFRLLGNLTSYLQQATALTLKILQTFGHQDRLRVSVWTFCTVSRTPLHRGPQ